MRLVKIPGAFGTCNNREEKKNIRQSSNNVKSFLKVGCRWASSSYHNVVVVQLETIEDPRDWSEEGGYSQWEGQALYISTPHNRYLEGKTATDQITHFKATFNVCIFTVHQMTAKCERCEVWWWTKSLQPAFQFTVTRLFCISANKPVCRSSATVHACS